MKLDTVLGLLPRVMRQVVDIIGVTATLMLVTAFGGSTYRVPLRKTDEGEAQFRFLADVIGDDLAMRLVEAFGGQDVYFALCADAGRELRNRAIRAEFDKLTQVDKLAAIRAVAQLAPRFRMSDRMIWHILKETDREEPARSEQANLF